ncbi:hypothetical protein JCM8202_001489 [Rhodotorula sphaerocarpa]
MPAEHRMSIDYAPLASTSGTSAWPSSRSPYSRSHALRAWLRTRTGIVTAAIAATTLVVGALAASSTPSGSGPSSTRLEHWTLGMMGKSSSAGGSHAGRQLRSDSTYAYGVAEPNEYGAYAEHPIHGLIREGKQKWAEKVKRQSTSYEGAVEVYRQRYRRDPPPGFKEWYDYAKEHDVQMLDEYDSLYEQIEPLLALRPSTLRDRLKIYDDKEGRGRDHGVITIKNGVITVGEGWRPAVTEGFAELMQPVAHLIPDVVVPLFLHDSASIGMDWESMQGYRRAARENRWVDEDKLPVSWDHDSVWTERERLCAPDSPYRRTVNGLDTSPPPAGPAFIHNHSSAMTFCMAPQLADIHGSLGRTAEIQKLLPSVSLSRLHTDADALWPSTIQYDLNPENESPFREKSHRLLWRGSADGIAVYPNMRWRQSHRFRLINLLNSNDTRPRTVRETRSDHFGREYQVDVEHSLAELNERYSNVRATGEPVQCQENICEHLKETMTFVPKASLEEMADNRYVMDVDGNAYSARFRAHLQSNQVPFKSTIFPGWFMDRIQPWVHYVPVRVDYADLYDTLAFFDGGLDPARTGHHDDLAEEIAMTGSEWAKKFWRIEDMRAYTLRLLLEWARAFDPARETSH